MNIPKRQHYVSQMQLRRFTNAQGQLYFFSKRFPEKGVLTSGPKKLFHERHLNTRYDKEGVKDVSVELAFAALEGQANRVIEKIVVAARNRLKPNLASNEKALWDLFFSYQWKRVPDLYRQTRIFDDLDDWLEEFLARYEATVRPLSDDERQAMQDPDVRNRIKQNAKVDATVTPSQEVLRILDQKGLCIAIISKPTKSFVIGSYPIVKLTHPGRAHLADPTVEVWLPIASDIAITPALSAGTEKLVEIKEDRHIRKINEATFKQSTMIAGRSKALIQSLAGSR